MPQGWFDRYSLWHQPDSKSGGWGFESLLACQENQGLRRFACFDFRVYVPITNVDYKTSPVRRQVKPDSPLESSANFRISNAEVSGR